MSSVPEQFSLTFELLYWMLGRDYQDPDLSEHERAVLWHVPLPEGKSLTWLAKHLDVPQSTLSVRVKDLERRGFLARSRDPADERRLYLELTDAGRRRLAAWTVLDTDVLHRALQSLEAEEQHRLVELAEKLAEAAMNLTQDPSREWRRDYVSRLRQWRSELRGDGRG